MGLILGTIAVGAAMLMALWRKTFDANPAAGYFFARRLKLGTNLLIAGGQFTGYVGELLSGTRTTLPATSSTTNNVSAALNNGGPDFGSVRASDLAS